VTERNNDDHDHEEPDSKERGKNKKRGSKKEGRITRKARLDEDGRKLAGPLIRCPGPSRDASAYSENRRQRPERRGMH
jgi:hypothetical protein